MQAKLGIKQVAQSLYKKPVKDRGLNAPKHRAEPGSTQQADLVYLPEDADGSKFALVVVDVGSGKTDAEPMKAREAEDAKVAIEAIYKRGKLKPPMHIMKVDQGSEFKGVFKKYFEDKNIMVHYAQAGRHRQQALVEQRNKIIGEAIHMHQTAAEQVRGETVKDWVHLLPDILEVINESASARYAKREDKERNERQDNGGAPPLIRAQGESKRILNEGTLVRHQLDNPQDFVSGKRNHGGFRAGDTRWSADTFTIDKVLLAPGQPVRYVIDDDPVTYTRNQLQVVKESDEPDARAMGLKLDNKDLLQVKELVAREKRGRAVFFKVRWVGFPKEEDQTFESRASLMKQIPDMVREFEKKHKVTPE